MKISNIKIYPALRLVKVESDEGLYGWGEFGLAARALAVAGAIEHYREFLVGRDPLQRGGLWQEMYRSQYFEGGRVLTAAISAIDIALHDLAGKALGVPVYQLLGGKQREVVPCFATVVETSYPQQMEEVARLVDSGWEVIRLAVAHPQDMTRAPLFDPRQSIDHTARLVQQVRERFGAGLVLGVDYHHRLSVAEAASFCQRLEPGMLDFIEEPIRDETPSAYEALRRLTGVPFALGEELASKWQFLPYIERDITQFVRIDVANVGGFTESLKIAAMAEAHYIDLMPHNPLGPVCTAAAIHLAAAVPNFAWLEYLPAAPGIEVSAWYENAPALEGTLFRVSDRSGLGIDVDETAVAAVPFRFTEPPHLRRADGSFTNW